MTATADRDGLFSPAYRRVTIALMSSVAIASYNNLSITAVLPDIGDDLGDVALLPWTITVELLAAAVAVLAIGPVVDVVGVRRTFRVTVVAFVVTSTLCALAPSVPILIAARALQGLTAGTVIAVAVTGTGLAFPDRLRPRAYAANSAVWGTMGVAGPAVAAAVVSFGGWRTVFLVNLPVGIAAAAIGWRTLPTRHDTTTVPVRARVDWAGLGIVSALTVAVLGATSFSVWSLPALVVAAALGVVYVRHARRATDPVVRLDHLVGHRWRGLHVASAVTLAAGTSMNAFLPIYARGARDTSTGVAAASVLFFTVAWSVAAYASSRLQERRSGEEVMMVGAVLLPISTGLLAVAVAVGAPLPVVFAVMFLVGCGVGTVTTSGLATIQGRAEAAEMGRVSSAHQFVRTLSISYGVAVAGALVFAVVGARVGDVESVRDVLGGGEHGSEVAEADRGEADADEVLGDETRDALADGYALAAAAATVVGLAGFVPARRLAAEARVRSGR